MAQYAPFRVVCNPWAGFWTTLAGMDLLTRAALATGFATRSEPTPTPTPAAVMPPPRAEVPALATVDDALTLDAVYRSVQILETAAMQLTLDVWRGRDLITDRVPSIATRPDVNMTAGAFYGLTVVCLATRGNAYWLKRRGPDKSVANLEILDPLGVMPYRDDRGRVRYACADGTDRGARDIAHLQLLRRPGHLLGLGPIQACAATLRGHLDVAGYGSQFFRSGEIPSGVLSTDQPLTAAQAAEWKAQWRAQRTAHDTAVLGSGLQYKHLGLTPAEVQWLENQRFGTVAVARLFGIPSRSLLVGVDGSSTTYANAEQEDLSFLRYSLMRYLREIELAVSDVLPRGNTARFNVDALLRTDAKTRYETHAVGINAGFLTVAEARAIEGLPTAMPAAPDAAAATPSTQEVPA